MNENSSLFKLAFFCSVLIHLSLLLVFFFAFKYLSTSLLPKKEPLAYTKVDLVPSPGKLAPKKPSPKPKARPQTAVSPKKPRPKKQPQPKPFKKKLPAPQKLTEKIASPQITVSQNKLTAIPVTKNMPPQKPKLTKKAIAPKNVKITGAVALRTLLYWEKPLYPDWARLRGLEGDVEVEFWVDPQGNVVRTEIFTRSGYTEFDYAAEKAVISWKFDPLDPRLPHQVQNGIVLIQYRLEE